MNANLSAHRTGNLRPIPLCYNVNAMAVHGLSGKEIEVITRFKALAARKAVILDMRVFGSRARGDATETSDLDVLVVTENLDHSIEKYISECAWEAGFPNDIIVMPVMMCAETLRNSPVRESVFIENVFREGISV